MQHVEIQTYGDLVQFLNTLAEHRERFRPTNEKGFVKEGANARTLEGRKANVIGFIENCFVKCTNKEEQNRMISELSYSDSTKTYSLVDCDPLQQLPKNFIHDRINRVHESTTNEEINNTLGTHRNLFKWLLNFLFPAPASKAFIDNYGLFSNPSEPMIDESSQDPGLKK